MCGAREKEGIAPEQRKALDQLLLNEETIYGKIRKSIYRHYIAS